MHDRSYDTIVGQPRNHHYENDIHYTLQMCQWLLKGIGVWPLVYRQTSKLEQLISLFLMTTCLSSLFFVIIPSGHHIFFVERNVHIKVKMLGPVGFCLSSTIKYLYLGLKGPSLRHCIRHLERDWKMVEDPRYRTIMLKYATIKRTRQNNTLRPLTYLGYDPFFDTQSSPTYEIVFCIHCVTAMVMYSVTTVTYSLAAIFVTHICGQIQIQIVRLQDLVKSQEKKEDGRDSFAFIVHDHVEVLRFSKNVEGALREMCLTEIIESTIIMCLLEYYCMTEWQNSDTIAILTYFTLLISFTFNIFIFCYIGEVLTEQCSQIGTVCYGIGWYNLPVKKAYDLVLLICVSQYPPKLTAGKIIDLSLNTFNSVAKTSVIYLNLLRTVTDW
ncbi:PREDICTED: uncharacterized protein LOC108550472 [Eufriesea mexicana]|uniref:uncharacterized protein LOC108550472 n=1 Tax=Eufriesea mexicana TaxID=516756 RepID=UPI00083C5432|nr:PREDICTED: uncharacterized protein LOC108550472 [Eufriesea mexicana]